MKLIVSLYLILFIRESSAQSILLPSILSDNMVLQQNSEVSVWGKAAPGDKIIVKPSWDKSVRTIASEKWIVDDQHKNPPRRRTLPVDNSI
jgi:hypothetical protein